MSRIFERTKHLLGEDALLKLNKSSVAIFGVGGVGSFTAEALVRTGIGRIAVIDYDVVDESNLNRQIHANIETIGKLKTKVMAERLMLINPSLIINEYNIKYNIETENEINLIEYDYIVDAIDMVSSKLLLIENAKKNNIPIISAMGAANKLDPSKLEVGDIYDTEYCPLAKVMRRELRKRNIDELKVVWSREEPIKINLQSGDLRKAVPTSAIFVPASSGLLIASEIVKDMTSLEV